MVRFARNALDNSRLANRDARFVGWTLVLLQASGLAMAQTAPPAKTEADIKTPYLDNYTPSEEVKRRAMGPLRIIKQMGDQKKPGTPAPAPAPTPVAAPAPVAPPKPKVEEVAAKAEKKAPVADTPVTPPPTTVAAPAPAPAPVAAPVAPAPEQPKVAKQANTDLIPIRQDPPVFNRSLMRDNPHAVVKVAFDINQDGSTGNVQVTSSNNRRLNSSATDAVAKWKFQPIDETVRVEIDVIFSLD